MVIAAAVGLGLRPAGLSLDPVGKGLACYCLVPDDTAISQERVILATFAGWYAQQRFSEIESITCPEFASEGLSTDWWGAADILNKLAGINYFSVKAELERRSYELVEQHWQAIDVLANALLAKEWEPLKIFASGFEWSTQTVAKYVPGDERGDTSAMRHSVLL